MDKNETGAKKRRTYSIADERARELARMSLNMSDEANTSVSRQDVLDALVNLLVTDGTVYKKVFKMVTQK